MAEEGLEFAAHGYVAVEGAIHLGEAAEQGVVDGPRADAAELGEGGADFVGGGARL